MTQILGLIPIRCSIFTLKLTCYQLQQGSDSLPLCDAIDQMSATLAINAVVVQCVDQIVWWTSTTVVVVMFQTKLYPQHMLKPHLKKDTFPKIANFVILFFNIMIDGYKSSSIFVIIKTYLKK